MATDPVVAQVQRKIELQAPEDLAYLLANVRRAAADRIEDIAARVVASDLPFGVVDGAAGVIGSIDRQAVIDVLVGKQTGP